MAQLISSCDCYISPSLAEGWNLPLLDALSCGKHAIATYYSAHTEFLTHKNSLLIYHKNLTPAIDGIWFNGEGNWIEWTKDEEEQFISHLRCIRELKNGNLLSSNSSGIETAKQFTWANTCNKMIESLNQCGK
jgi:glycosyltransferase involved in cell wall biosynthesis